MDHNWNFIVVTPPASLPVTYQQAARQLRLPDDHDQPYVNDAIAAAVDYVQSEIDGSLITQTLQVTHYECPSQRFYLPRGPIQSISSVTADGLTIASSLYSAQGAGTFDYLYCRQLLAPPVVITYVAGYASIPNDLKQALLVQLAQFYEFREGQSPRSLAMVAHGLDRIYEKYRRGPRMG
jgi:uncharacterized phiE125 gp8 family phage protein